MDYQYACLFVWACVFVFVCVCVSALRLVITSDIMWHDTDPIQLVKKFYSCYIAIVAVIINGRGFGIDTHGEN